MPIYKGTTEITKLADLLTEAEHDIQWVYFGDKQVFTVWDTYDGTLPATYIANGSMLADYRIYGVAGGVGDDSGTEYGYVLPMSVSDGTTSTTTPIYIGDEPLDAIGDYADYVDYHEGKINRAVGILELKGDELWNTYGAIPTDFVPMYIYIGISPGSNSLIRCNTLENIVGGWYQNKDSISWWTLNRYFVTLTNATLGVTGNDSATIRVEAFKRYLREQYDNGTPIKVWYVRATASEVDPPVPLPQLPTCNGTTITNYAGKGATASNNVLPSSTAQTQTSGNLSVTCDGEGRYHINKTGSGDLYVYFDIPEFTIPISKQGGGNGTVSFFNTMNSSAMVIFMNGSTSVDSWQMNSTNRQTDGYGTMAGKTINRIGFNCWGDSWTGDINIMFTDNGVLPSAFEPPSHALPRPSRFEARYRKKNF